MLGLERRCDGNGLKGTQQNSIKVERRRQEDRDKINKTRMFSLKGFTH